MKFVRRLIKLLFLPWVMLVFPSFTAKLLEAIDKRTLEYRRDALIFDECHTIRIARLRPYECAEIFTHPPTYVKTFVNIMGDTLVNFNKCGVPCEDIFTLKYTGLAVVGTWMLNQAVVRDALKSLFNYVKKR